MDEKTASEDSPYWKLIGLKEVSLNNGSSLIELPVKYEITQRRGTVHGGVIASMVDSAAGAAIRSLLEPNQQVVTVEMKLNYIRPVKGDRIIGRGKVINLGNTLAVAEANIISDEDNIIASGMATFMVLTDL